MTSITDRVPVDAITAHARRVRVGRVLLTVIAAVFFSAGWVAARLVLAVVWCAVAVKLGWQEGRHGGPARPDL